MPSGVTSLTGSSFAPVRTAAAAANRQPSMRWRRRALRRFPTGASAPPSRSTESSRAERSILWRVSCCITLIGHTEAADPQSVPLRHSPGGLARRDKTSRHRRRCGLSHVRDSDMSPDEAPPRGPIYARPTAPPERNRRTLTRHAPAAGESQPALSTLFGGRRSHRKLPAPFRS